MGPVGLSPQPGEKVEGRMLVGRGIYVPLLQLFSVERLVCGAAVEGGNAVVLVMVEGGGK